MQADQIERESLESLSGRSLPGDVKGGMVPVLRLLWERRTTLLRFVAWGTGVAIIIAFSLPRRYEAAARLLPPDNSTSSNLQILSALAGGGSGLTNLANNFLGMKTTGGLYVGVLRSRTLQDRLIQRFDLRNVYWKRTDEDTREKLSDRTSISEDRKSGIITVGVTDSEAQRARDIANAYAEELNRLLAEVSTSAAHRERVFIEERLSKVSAELDRAAKEFSEFASKNATIDIREQGRAVVEAAAGLEAQRVMAESELQSLRQVYSESNVRVRSLQARIDELNRQIEIVSGTNISNSRTGIRPLKSRDSELPFPRIRDLPRLGVTYAELYRRVKIQETIFELLTQQFELAKVQEVKDTPSAKLLDAAVVPTRRAFPPRVLIIFLMTTGAAICGVLYIGAQSAWRSLRGDHPARLLYLEVSESSRLTLSMIRRVLDSRRKGERSV